MLVGVAMDARAMTRLYVTEHGLFMLILKSGAWLAIGGMIGACHYMTLRWNVQMLATGSSVPAALAIQLIRLAIMAGVLAIITRHYGAPPLLVAALGVVASRAAALRLGAVS
jgi:F1F0 ATPase subunit 2